ncbi:MAG: hypothetical protein DHS80DRAFT_23993 [Piptocephalis tieghemiana]|nr:MAG: hypothetical protein DHS80DRAFT_23993 [Piptocephalis tieghemiana]
MQLSSRLLIALLVLPTITITPVLGVPTPEGYKAPHSERPMHSSTQPNPPTNTQATVPPGAAQDPEMYHFYERSKTAVIHAIRHEEINRRSDLTDLTEWSDRVMRVSSSIYASSKTIKENDNLDNSLRATVEAMRAVFNLPGYFQELMDLSSQRTRRANPDLTNEENALLKRYRDATFRSLAATPIPKELLQEPLFNKLYLLDKIIIFLHVHSHSIIIVNTISDPKGLSAERMRGLSIPLHSFGALNGPSTPKELKIYEGFFRESGESFRVAVSKLLGSNASDEQKRKLQQEYLEAAKTFRASLNKRRASFREFLHRILERLGSKVVRMTDYVDRAIRNQVE